MIYGYARVSTTKQDINGNGLESQIAELINNGVAEENIITDTYTGTKTDRPNFTKLLEQMKAGDTLVVTKLDRIARSVSAGSELIKDLISEGITVNVLNIGVLSNTSMNQLLVNILLAFAQFERDLIIERTQAGKEIAKQNPNFRDGRPTEHTDMILETWLKAKEDNNWSYAQLEKESRISKSSFMRYNRKKKAELMINEIK